MYKTWRAIAHEDKPIKPYDILMAVAHGRRALRRGRLAEAERWFKLAERAGAVWQRLDKLRDDEFMRNSRFNPP